MSSSSTWRDEVIEGGGGEGSGLGEDQDSVAESHQGRD